MEGRVKGHASYWLHEIPKDISALNNSAKQKSPHNAQDEPLVPWEGVAVGHPSAHLHGLELGLGSQSPPVCFPPVAAAGLQGNSSLSVARLSAVSLSLPEEQEPFLGSSASPVPLTHPRPFPLPHSQG